MTREGEELKTQPGRSSLNVDNTNYAARRCQIEALQQQAIEMGGPRKQQGRR